MGNRSDFIIIGSGIAGLTFAIHAACYGTVTMITKKSDKESNTNRAQGGIACVLDPLDSFESHIADTLATGKGLSNIEAVNILVKDGPDCITNLINWGALFSQSEKKSIPFSLDLGKEGGHSCNRIVHANDLTGSEVERILLEKAKSDPNIRILEHHCAIDLITEYHTGKPHTKRHCFGVYVLDTVSNTIKPLLSKVTCLSTGGSGRVYLNTTNPEIATGDGIAIAYRSGARVANMEFIQFHPTTLYHEKAESFLISEALRGFGAILKNKAGEEFMERYHPLKSLAPRDVVAQAIDNEMKISGEPCVYLDIRHIETSKTKKHFPNIYSQCKKFGIDITKDLIPVVPAAHYMCGGIVVDINGNTDITNCYACGEVAHTGVHGANRLASNSLLEALVFSKRAADDAGAKLKSIKFVNASDVPPWDDSGTIETEEWILLSHNFKEIQTVMWDYVGIVRSNVRLKRALRRIILLEKEIKEFYKRTKVTAPLLELRNVVTTAKLIVTSAIKRKESRGLHFTTDYPTTDDRKWKRDTIISRKLS
jgi:L-aspartate oxidase